MKLTKDRSKLRKAGQVLLDLEEHQILQGQQLIIRTKLLELGKKTKDPALWTALEWFDRCIRIPDKMAGLGMEKTQQTYAAPVEDTDL